VGDVTVRPWGVDECGYLGEAIGVAALHARIPRNAGAVVVGLRAGVHALGETVGMKGPAREIPGRVIVSDTVKVAVYSEVEAVC